MTISRWLMAFAIGIGLTMLQFIVVGALNQSGVSDRDELARPATTPPVIVTPPPESVKSIPKTETRLRSATQKPLEAAARLAPSALSTLALSHGKLALGSMLPNLGETNMGSIDVVDVPSEPDRKARARRTVAPVYPISAQRNGIEGYVLLRLSIDAAGKVVDVMVIDSEPIGVFERSAREAARRFEFSPAKVGGSAVSTTLEKKILFTLQ